jgi:signal peptidase II
LVVVAGYLKRARPEQWRLGAELGLLAGGALGNVLDRAMYGRVTDFIVWRLGSHEWPTFNVADAALVVGIVGLLFDMRPDEGTQSAKKKVA